MAAGRLSSNDPNLQNIPIRTELGRGIRKAFVAADGYRLASFDYSQIELRVLAHMCGEPALVEAFNNHEDVHTVTAQEMFGLGAVKLPRKSSAASRRCSTTPCCPRRERVRARIAARQRLLDREAKALISQYNERFPSVKEFTTSVVMRRGRKALRPRCWARRRYFPDIHAPKISERKAAERQAMNAPIQGTAADMLKLAMLNIHKNGCKAARRECC